MIFRSVRMIANKFASYSLRFHYIMNKRHVHDLPLRSHDCKQACIILATLSLYHEQNRVPVIAMHGSKVRCLLSEVKVQLPITYIMQFVISNKMILFV